jgi:hypothetical protein
LVRFDHIIVFAQQRSRWLMYVNVCKCVLRDDFQDAKREQLQ